MSQPAAVKASSADAAKEPMRLLREVQAALEDEET